VARKIRGFERVLDAPALFAVAYGEITASVYFALGIVAAEAFGLTPAVLLASGLLFVVVAMSYAEGAAALAEPGGAETFTRRAFNDVAGFAVGWALFLDYLIVMALSALFIPHYLGIALSLPGLRSSPWDVVVAVVVIAGVAGARLVRRMRAHAGALVVACLDLAVQALLLILGFAVLFSGSTFADGLGLADGQGWSDLLFALPLAMLAYTGLETVANLAAEAREPGTTLPRSTFAAIALVVGVTVLIAVVAVTALPAAGGANPLGTQWLEAPMAGIVSAFGGELPAPIIDMLRVVVGLSGALILLAAASTSVSGITRLAFSMAEHGMLPRELGRLERRTLVSSEAIVAVAVAAAGIVVGTAVLADDPIWIASAYSFGVLLAFTAAQLAILRLRWKEPRLARPFRARPEVRFRGVELPIPALVGAPLAFAVWILALVMHPGARYAGPAWLAAGIGVFLLVRLRRHRGLLEDIEPIRELPAAATLRRVLVPMKLGDIGEEMIATAIAFAKQRGAEVEAIFVVRVPRQYPL
jgi:APA family basic amino acid/polyamine antiporter